MGSTGYISMRLYTIVYTGRGARKRISSLRKASPQKMGKYAQT